MAAHRGGRGRGGAASCRAGVLAVLLSAALHARTVAAQDGVTSAASSRVPGARELEGRLIAPCCWTQTLDIHDSPISEQLRAEIAQRLTRGEKAAAIEDDLAARYGEKIRAVPRGEDPRQALPLIVGSSMGVAAIWLLWLGVSWLRRSRASSPTPTSAEGQGQQYDKQLDEELEHLSDVR